MLRLPKYFLLLITSIALFTNSCKKDEPLGADISFIAIYNATTNATGLNFLINNESITSTLVIGQKAIYYGVYAGVWGTQAIPSNSSSKAFTQDLTFTAGEHNSLFVVGPVDTLSYFIIKDDLSIKDPSHVKIKFLNLSPNSGTLSLEMQILGTVSKFTGKAFKEFSDYQSFNAGTIYTLTLKNNVTNATVGTPITAEFVQGKVYTVWARGTINTQVEAQRLAIQISEVN
jgi:hypothetical protein